MVGVRLPVAIAAVNDYELIVAGVASLLSAYPERLAVRDRLVIGDPITGGPIQVALYDTYGRIGVAAPALRALLAMPDVQHVAVFSLELSPALVADARAAGASGFISKALSGDAIADAIVDVAGGTFVHAHTAIRACPSIASRALPDRTRGAEGRRRHCTEMTQLSDRLLAALSSGWCTGSSPRASPPCTPTTWPRSSARGVRRLSWTR
jgi:DNA-binding NarL/FixJ family response regulator